MNVKKGRTVLETLKRRKDNCNTHITKGNGILSTICDGSVDGRRRRGRKHSRSQMMTGMEAVKDPKENENCSGLWDLPIGRTPYNDDVDDDDCQTKVFGEKQRR